MNKEYTIKDKEFGNVRLVRGNFTFSADFIARAKDNWAKAPGKYDGILMGVKRFYKQRGTLTIEVFPMNYSWHRYVARTIESGAKIAKEETIYPLCIVGLSYIQGQNGKNFVIGIKKSGNIDGGKVECIPQGFCDMKEGSLDTYLHTMLSEELHEELGADVNLGTFKIRALATDDTNSQYALMAEFEVEEDEVKKHLGKEGTEHEQIILIEESDLETMIKNPGAYMKSKGIKVPPNLEIAPMTRCALELFIS